MYSIKLVINTGVHWIDVVELPVYSDEVAAVMTTAYGYDSMKTAIDRTGADRIIPHLEKAVTWLDDNVATIQDVDCALSARAYLSKLLAACKYHPGCEVRVETI